MNHFPVLMGIIIIISAYPLQGQFLSYTPKTDSLIETGIDQLHNFQLEPSIETFEKLIQYYPDHPIGYFYKAGVYDVFNQNYRITVFEKKFEDAVDLAIKKGEEFIKKNKKDVLAYFYLGGAYGFRGLHGVYKRDWLHVFIDGYKGLKNLQKALDERPDFYDAYFGLGLYHYWRSAMTKKLRFLPFVSDQRQRGIQELKLTVEKGKYAGVESRIALQTVYFNEAEYDSGLVINNWLFDRYPNDPSIVYCRARIYEKKQEWEKMLTMSQKLVDILNDYEHKSIGYQVEYNYLLALAYSNLNQNEQSIQHLRTAMQLKESRNKNNELEGPYEDFDEVIKNVKDLYETLTKE